VRRILVLALPALVLAPVAATPAGCTPADCGPGSTIVRSAGLLDYRPGGPAGPLLAYGLSGGKVRFRLPPGLLSADGRTFLTSGARYDARTGRVSAAARVPAGR
jgi:hypothetical protein